MAIRAGSGGLKYPLPNQAQIAAQQAAASASAGGSASASAYGANRRYAGLKKQMQYDAFQSGLDRGFRAQQAFFDREHEKGGQLEAQRAAEERQAAQFQQQSEMQWQDQYFTDEQNRQNRQFTAQRDKALFEQDQTQFERDVDATIEGDIRSGKLALPPAAQRDLDNLEATRSSKEVQSLDTEQRAEYEALYEQARRKILRQAQAPQGPTGSAVFNQGTTYVDPTTGRAFDEPGEGRVPYNVEDRSPLVEEKPANDGEYRKEVTKRADELMRSGVNGGKPYTREEALKAAAAEVQEDERFFAPPEPEQAEGAPPLPQGAPVAGGAPDAAPQAPVVPADATRPALGMGDSVQARSSVDPSQEGLPQGLPEGSAWVDPSTIRLPDGRIIRRKG